MNGRPLGGTIALLSALAVSMAGCGGDRSDANQRSSASVTPVSAAATATPSSAPPADPAVAGHDLTAVQLLDHADVPRSPLRLELVLSRDIIEPQLIGHEGSAWGPYVSEDGQLGLTLEDPLADAARPLRTFRIDVGNLVEEVLMKKDPACKQVAEKGCDLRGLQKSVDDANRILKTRRCVPLLQFFPLPYVAQGSSCDGEDVTRHSQVLGYEVHFTPPHLRIVRQADGAVVIDRDFPWDEEQREAAGKCAGTNPPIFALGGIAVERRALFVLVTTCKVSECGGRVWPHFFRLPPPLKP